MLLAKIVVFYCCFFDRNADLKSLLQTICFKRLLVSYCNQLYELVHACLGLEIQSGYFYVIRLFKYSYFHIVQAILT